MGRPRVVAPAAMTLSSPQIKRTRSRLLRWGRQNFKNYPWRSKSDPWLTLAAEFMLQRTRASQVVPAFNEFCDRFPTAEHLVIAGERAGREITRYLGLHRRGPLLIELARQVVRCGGSPPENLRELRRFSGVGEYTAAAWLSLHRGKRAVIIDANVARWLSRMTGRPYNRDPRHVRWVQDLAGLLTPRRVFRDYNYAVLDFTIAICTPRQPACTTCPLRTDCRFFYDATFSGM